MSRFGLPEKTIALIHGLFTQVPEIQAARIYGSRAKGTYKNGSDIDITLISPQLTEKIRMDLAGKLDAPPFPIRSTYRSTTPYKMSYLKTTFNGLGRSFIAGIVVKPWTKLRNSCHSL